MKTTIIWLALVLCSLATSAHSEETAPKHPVALVSRLTCPAVREAVKLYGAAAAEQWARSHGASEARIEQAKRCLK
jgi:hypothetical protein